MNQIHDTMTVEELRAEYDRVNADYETAERARARSELRVKNLEYRAVRADPQEFEALADEIDLERERLMKRAYKVAGLCWRRGQISFALDRAQRYDP